MCSCYYYKSVRGAEGARPNPFGASVRDEIGLWPPSALDIARERLETVGVVAQVSLGGIVRISTKRGLYT